LAEGALDWITDEVAIGNYLEARDAAFLKQHAFRSLVSLDGSLSASHAAEFGLAEVVAYRLIDGAGNDLRVFQYAIVDLRRLVQRHPTVLVQCHAGRSRSAVVVAAYLMQAYKLCPTEAIAAVAARREINITPELVELLHSLDG
jgi:protein-tyrosine phosphatase